MLIGFKVSWGTSIPPVTVPSAYGQTFQEIKIVRTEGGKSNERNVILQFADEDIMIEAAGPTLNIKHEIPYDKMTKAVYEKSKLLGVAASLLVSVFFLFSKPKKHWLTIY
ncbi:hypothetical protein CEE39_03705 [bacterium (candidate division B38) B3_B38]|nr:MAG: hypothetical protein CEE39_03705 [bacterium (candidate division B38) B3_B38]